VSEITLRYAILGSCIVIVVAGLFGLGMVARRYPARWIFAISSGAFAGGVSLLGETGLGFLVLRGCLQMFGFAGLICGMVFVLRKTLKGEEINW